MTARILVVDDLFPNVKLLEAKLQSEYFDVVTAMDGPSALEAIQIHSPDLVLLDVMMPGMNGFEVCEAIKADPETTHIPVVMVTALSDPADRVRGLEAGADDFLTKPLNDTALFARVRSLVRLKILTDEWRLREQTSDRFGVLEKGNVLTEADTSGAHVLLVEDNSNDLKRVRDALESDSAIITHSDSINAARHVLAEDTAFDLVVVNLDMKVDDPLRFVSQLRANETTRYTPILILAEEHDMDRVAKGLDLGVNDYLLKPIDRNEFLARARTQIKRQRYQERLRENYERSLVLALTDPLTGAYNRRYLTAHLDSMIQRHARNSKPLALMMFDIDFFKKVNDTYGHGAGDEVLVELAMRVNLNVRAVDLVARIGGEEFVAVMPDTEMDIAKIVCERIRKTVADTPFEMSSVKTSQTVTISIGVAPAEEGDTGESLIRRADEALYAAKESGRNKIVVMAGGELSVVDMTTAPESVRQVSQ